MAVVGRIFAAFVTFTLVKSEYQASIYGMQRLLIFGETSEQREFIKTYEALPGYDFLKLTRSTDVPIEVLVAPHKLDQFKNDLNRKNIKYDIFIEDVSKVIEENLTLQNKARRLRTDNILKAFPRHNEIINYLKNIANQYNDIAHTFSIGKSYEGRDLLGLKISSGSGKKPAVVIDAGIHAREWIAPTTALYAIQQLVENATNHFLFEDVDIYIIPSLNPDGYEFSHQNAQTRIWRKTRSNHLSGASCLGVDANRNFDIAWKGKGLSAIPCSETYSGPKPFSEPEADALRKFMLSLKGSIKAYVSLHSFGQYLLHPWGFTRTPPKTAEQLKCVGEAAAAEIFKHRELKYTVGSVIEVLYAGSGSSMDWAMAEAGVEISYTIELPGGEHGFAPPPSEIIPVGRETFDALAIFIKYAKGAEIC